MSDIKRRNPVARSLLLRKGGVHEKTQSAKRQQQRIKDSQSLDDWREELEFEREMQNLINRNSVDEVFFSIELILAI